MDGPSSSLPDLPGSSSDERPTTPRPDLEQLMRDHARTGGAAAGDAIGPYKLLCLLGEGGFGEVWLAERREPFVQRVAIKLIKPGMDSRAVLARFEQERQALAVMDHPNVAKVLDGGVTTAAMGARPFFVMEHVQGESITMFCDRHTYTFKQRLELFVQVCEAVQHAHHKGIIHRDIKPSNILVTLKDDKPIPKVIDFGVAKAISQSLTDKTIFTEQGRLIGTPEYMSPEQAEMGAVDIDTRTDVYSLGVVLYELLSGMLPFDPKSLRAAGYEAIRKIIREQDPPKPSTRLTTADDATAAAIATKRESELEALGRELRRELDWIPLKALRKDRVERYRTPSDLADDIRRYLNGEALEAGPEGAGYRVKKYVRRHKGPVLAGASVLATLVAGLATTLWQTQTARREAGNARAAESEQRRLVGEKDVAARQAEERRTIAEQKTAEAEAARRSAERESYIANLYAAAAALEAGEPARLRTALDACPARLRGWEWGYLNAESDTSLLELRGHTGPVNSVSFSPDGKRIVTASKDGTARVWDTASGKELVAFHGHALPAEVSAITVCDKWVIAPVGRDSAVVTDATSGETITHIRDSAFSARSAAFALDGRRVVSMGMDAGRIWDAESGRELTTLCDEKFGLMQSDVSPDGTRVLTHSVSFAQGKVLWTVRLWDAATGQKLPLPECTEGDPGLSPRFSPDGTRVLTVSSDETFRIWSSATGELVTAFKGDELPTQGSATIAGGKRTVTNLSETDTEIRDSDSGRVVFRGRYELARAVHAAFSPDGKRVVSTGWDTVGRVWDAESGRPIAILCEPDSAVNLATFSPDGAYILTVLENRTARVWDAARWRPLRVFGDAKREVWSAVAISNDTCVTRDRAGRTLRLWKLSTGEEMRCLLGPPGASASGYSPVGSHLVMASSLDGTARVWDVAPVEFLRFIPPRTQEDRPSVQWREIGSGRVLRRPLNAARSEQGALSADGSRSAKIMQNGNSVRIRDSHGNEVSDLNTQELVQDAALNHDGSRAVSASVDRTARIWDASTGKELMALRGHEDSLTAAAFSPDGTRVVTSSVDATFRIWDPTSGRELLVVRSIGRAFWASFDDTGTRLLCNLQTVDSIPYRIRIAERDANARGEDGGAIVKAWLREVTGGRESWTVAPDAE